MNILFISSGNALNGISPLIENQGNSLKECGHNVDFFTVKGKGFRGYLDAALNLRKFLKGKRYDLLHAHYGLSAIIALLANRGFPLVVSFMGDDLLGSNQKNGKIHKISKLLIAVNRFLARSAYDFAIVKSSQMMKNFRSKNVEVIPNGVDLDNFYPEDKSDCRSELNLSNNEIIIVFVSDPARPEKNFKLAQEAVNRLNRADAKLIPVFNRNHNEIRKWLNASDVVILTSYHEGSPNIIKEAMACNCPVVSTDVGDVKIIFSDTAGCFLGAFTPNDFAKKINEAIIFSARESKTRGRQRIIDLKMDSDSIAERIITVYKKVLKII